ncbi:MULTISPECIES: DUF3267 domain-containing protein [Tenacibaculum]|uniref:DUF3267 domain-containing protein n=1 Tax=Tenacibaculum TaxID=104267 RepID=UPI000C4A0EEA|nr:MULTISPECIES: DUF3267 domain-containing protein [Tenacibaculum]MCD8425012.1 DUF3267 domain-containing protein [Tenacibaculum dicentrarchi]MBE7635139.1 DUF3267 domain-containing protein [Tenacibaculum finnmarkense genomovar ulcerans]MBE7646787.1 DUF3267 domain-containing protein [Tenacibaculum finnmarkense genomovar ulcerans]MCD8431092.1 DUF3267 domain-containing protein [Tenacibaculum finnmarkense genomovar ulcerans]MCG8184443.1 DUF3267 domain-containing protein [Tenacibaculum piscium]
MNNLENYKKTKLTIDTDKASISAILMLIPIALIYGLPFFLINDNELVLTNYKSFLIKIELYLGMFAFPTLILFFSFTGIIIHELIHGITWSLFSKKGLKSIKYGVLWKKLTPYCHCKEPLLLKNYILGAIMPAVILGIIPAVYSIISGNLVIFGFAIFFTMGAIGDFLIIKLIIKENRNSFALDHPSELGCFIYHKI